MRSNLVPFRAPSNRPALPSKTRARVLLLQGPVGPFFKRLHIFLQNQGFDVWRVTFNAGDRLWTERKRHIDFAGSLYEWEGWLQSFLQAASIDHIVLFGSTRPAHAVARQVAKKAGIHLLSLEEGYIRPGFVTVENSGNNADSELAGHLPPENFREEGEAEGRQTDYRGFKAMCAHGAAYYSARGLVSSFRERALFHRRLSLPLEAFCWARNYWRRLTLQSENFRTIEGLLEHHDQRYFLIPLQVSTDGQMGPSARGWASARLISSVLSSFARSGPKGYRLVFKIHPLERGHSNDRRLIGQTARALGVEDRVDVIDTGSIGLLTRHSAGMITINSSSGLSAIFHGVPLLVIGDALYANSKLAICAQGIPDFDLFWTSRFVADAQLRRKYLAWITNRCLKPGDFYSRRGILPACEGVLEEIRAARSTPAVKIGLAS